MYSHVTPKCDVIMKELATISLLETRFNDMRHNFKLSEAAALKRRSTRASWTRFNYNLLSARKALTL